MILIKIQENSHQLSKSTFFQKLLRRIIGERFVNVLPSYTRLGLVFQYANLTYTDYITPSDGISLKF